MDWNFYVLMMQKPAYQALLFLLITPLLVFIFQPRNADIAWVIAFCAFASFLLVNAVGLWFDDSPWRYFFLSIGCAVGYILLIGVIMPPILKVFNINGSGESGMAFLVIIYQPFILLLVMLVKWVMMKWF